VTSGVTPCQHSVGGRTITSSALTAPLQPASAAGIRSGGRDRNTDGADQAALVSNCWTLETGSSIFLAARPPSARHRGPGPGARPELGDNKNLTMVKIFFARGLEVGLGFSMSFSVPRRERSEEDDMTNLDRGFDENVYDLNAILHPGSVFDHPRDVLAETTLSRAEKRAILASWASDAAAVASCPSLRAVPGTKRAVSIDEILEALSSLDHSPRNPPGGKPVRLKSTARTPLAA
jgi:hypothetical protein